MKMKKDMSTFLRKGDISFFVARMLFLYYNEKIIKETANEETF